MLLRQLGLILKLEYQILKEVRCYILAKMVPVLLYMILQENILEFKISPIQVLRKD
ncbi:hypothetical protein DEMA109039_19980 [Deinococcus marmoris]